MFTSKNYSFDSIKEQVQNAQQGLSVGWKNIADKAKKDVKVVNKIARKALATEDGGKLRDGYVVTVDLNAGFDLFKLFQDNWVLFHKESVMNVNKAGQVDHKLNIFVKEWQKCESYLEEFLGNLTVLPEVISNLEVIQTRCNAIGVQAQQIEELICEYEDACERYELEKCKVDMKIKLSQLLETKHAEYTVKKSLLEGNKEMPGKRTASFTVNKQSEESESAEKQKAYEDAFLDQMNQYIQYGEIEKPITGIIDAHDTVSVEDININDSDLSTLREFLGPEEINSVIQAQASQSRSSKQNDIKNEISDNDNLSKTVSSCGSGNVDQEDNQESDEINADNNILKTENEDEGTALPGDNSFIEQGIIDEKDSILTNVGNSYSSDIISMVDDKTLSAITREQNIRGEIYSDEEDNEFFDAPCADSVDE